MLKKAARGLVQLASARRHGATAERVAAHYLERAGLSLVARNYRSPFGEIDLVMQHDDTLVFVEVRYRGRSDYGTAAETVDRRKQSRLRATAEHFLQHDRRACNRPCRFDIVAVAPSTAGDCVQWLRNAF
jgi:putative endonuclease